MIEFALDDFDWWGYVLLWSDTKKLWMENVLKKQILFMQQGNR